MARSRAVIISSLKMAVATFCSRILGLVREQVMAAMFGASGITDAFLVAYRIPNLMRDLFAEGAFSSAFVPTFVEANQQSREEARKLLWRLFIILSIITGVISFLTVVGAPQIITVFAPTFKENPQKFELTVAMTRLMAPFLTFVSVAALFMGALNSVGMFFIPALAPASLNICMIASMLILPSFFYAKGIPAIYALGAGVFIGGLVQAFIQFPFLLKKGLAPTKVDKIWGQKEKKVIKLLGPGLVGFAAAQINLLVNTILASSTVVGAVSWLSYSFRLFQLPVGILSVSIGNSNLIHFSNAWKKGEKETAKSYLQSSVFMSFFVIFPAMLALYIFADEMVNVIFERGRFDGQSTIMTAKALRWYALGLPFYGLNKIFVPTFYTIDRQKIPVYSSITAILINIIFCVLLTPIYGFEILAFGTSLSVFVSACLQSVIIKKDLQLPLRGYLNLRFLKLILAAGVSTFVSYQFKNLYIFSEHNFFERCLILFGGLVIIALSYLILVLLLGEKNTLRNVLNRRK